MSDSRQRQKRLLQTPYLTFPFSLAEATKPLLEKSTLPNGKFIYIGSSAGAMADVATFGGHPPAAYFASKAAGHFLLRCIAQQDDKLVISCFCPGLVSLCLV